MEQKLQFKHTLLYNLQIQTCLPPAWKKKLIKYTVMSNKNIIRGNAINVNKKYTILDKITCKDYYWHIININTLPFQLINGLLFIKILTMLKALY